MKPRRCDGCGCKFEHGMHERPTKTHDERNVVLLCEWCALDYEAERAALVAKKDVA